MGWFTQLCRNTGLMIHHIVRPDDAPPARREVRRTVEEQRVSPTTTFRRTVIEEVEVRRDVPPPE